MACVAWRASAWVRVCTLEGGGACKRKSLVWALFSDGVFVRLSLVRSRRVYVSVGEVTGAQACRHAHEGHTKCEGRNARDMRRSHPQALVNPSTATWGSTRQGLELFAPPLS